MKFENTLKQVTNAPQQESEESLIRNLGILYCCNRGLSGGPNIVMYPIKWQHMREAEQNYKGYYEADFLYITKNNYLYEVEIKISIEDFRADQNKASYHDHPDVRGFYYCIPWLMYSKYKDEILETCKSKGAGLIVNTSSRGLMVFQKPKQRKEVPALDAWHLIHYLRLFAFKWVGRY